MTLNVGRQALALVLLMAVDVADVPCFISSQSALASEAAKGDASPSVSFPGEIQAVRSPTGRYEIKMTKVHGISDAPTYQLMLNDLLRHSHQEIATFERSVELTWRIAGEGFFLNKYSASNFSDCVVAVPGKRLVLQSMAKLLSRQKGVELSETVDNSHYYVECTGWSGDGEVLVSVYGHHDDNGEEFSHKLKYDMTENTLMQLVAK